MTIDRIENNMTLLDLAKQIIALIAAAKLEEMDGDPVETLKAMIFEETVEIG